MDTVSPGDRIRGLISSARSSVEIIAPFIKVGTLRTILEAVPATVPVRCVTRWLPQEVASGVSDIETLDLLEQRGNAHLSLVDNLHAKLYIADSDCLAGSANVTYSGFGDSPDSNIEVLIATTAEDQGVAATLADIELHERPATRELADQLRAVVDYLGQAAHTTRLRATWFPRSRKPKPAFRRYQELYSTNIPRGLTTAERLTVEDIVGMNLAPGLAEREFDAAVRDRLEQIEPASALLAGTGDALLTFKDTYSFLSELDMDGYSEQDLWRAFIEWMAHFYPDRVMKQSITEIALRRAQHIH
ncbi:MAG: phospholipase D family protein [bacterium]|nr:phospholipase D family protein [bacterium]